MKSTLRLFLPLLFFTTTFVSCNKHFTPSYNDAAIQMVGAGQFLTKLLHAPENATYNDTLYVLYNDYIKSLRDFDLSRPNSKTLIPIINIYQSAVANLRWQHKAKGTLTPKELIIHNKQMQAHLQNILDAENNFNKPKKS